MPLHAQDLQRNGVDAYQIKLDNVTTSIYATTSDAGDGFYVHSKNEDAALCHKTSQLFHLKGAMAAGGGADHF